MTKKDGDRLRAMSAELVSMASAYDANVVGPDSVADHMLRVAMAIDLALAGRRWTIVARETKSYQFLVR